MKYYLLLLFSLVSLYSVAQVSTTKVVRIADASTTFSEPLSKGNILIDIATDNCYLILQPVDGTKSLADLTINVDYKAISGSEFQTIDVAQLNGTKLQLSLSNDGEATHQIELNSLSGGSGDSSFVKVTADTLLVADNISYVDSAHGIKINTNLTIEADGTIRMDNDASVWDDLKVFPDAVKIKADKPPTDAQFKTNGSGSTGVFLNAFSPTDEQQVFFTIQLPHSYKEGSTLYPHVHWTPMSGNPSGTDVTWGLEYTIIRVGQVFANTTIIKGSNVISALTGPFEAGQHLINELPVIESGPSEEDADYLKISSIIVCRLFRDPNDVNDTFSNSVGLLGMDFHYEKDTQGSREEFVK